ncbi:MAG: hypothetical protein KF887_08185 [Paracoccaceae bacterium]|nr:MAG: hypothetical protein KF887_08185 [Paracoccaceae bacterium]
MTGGDASGRRVLIHLGMPKTGTTALQNALRRLTDRTAPHVIYPTYARDSRWAHHQLAEDLRAHLNAGGEPEVHAAGLVTDLLGLPRYRGDCTAVYSSEAFANLCGHATAPMLRRWLATIRGAGRLMPVIYLREMTAFLESMYLQSARFGNAGTSFEDYLAPRPGWFRNLCLGLTGLVAEGVEVAFAGKGYDILAEFDRRLMLAEGTLRSVSGPALNVRPGYKVQTILTHLPRVEERLRFGIDRHAFLKTAAGKQAIPGDTAAYSLFTPAGRRQAKARFDAIAAEAGLIGYVQAFAGEPPPDLPFMPLDFAALAPADFDWLAAHRQLFAL